jgi:hypothetical protein
MNSVQPTSTPEIVPPQRSVLEPPTVSFPKVKQSKFKNFLFWFFVIEHIVIILLVISLSFFYVKTYAFSEFGELDKKARSYAIQPTNDVSDAVFRRFATKLPKSFESNSPLEISADVTEQEVSSFLSGINLDHVSKAYVRFKDQNQIFIWILPAEVNQAFMLHYNFEYKNNKIDLTTRNAQLGPVPVPISWVGFLEESLENTTNNYISNAQDQYELKINNIKTEDERFILDMRFENPEHAAQIILE